MIEKKFLMDKQKLLLYLSKLNEVLSMDDVHLELFISGGANMCLYVQSRDATHDIDVSTRSMDKDGGVATDLIAKYAGKVADMMNLPLGWLNTGGNLVVTKKMLEDVVKGIEMSHLTVWFFGWKTMLVQKISANREQPDITDSIALIRKHQVRDLDEVDGWMKELLGDWYSISSRYKGI